MTIPMMPTNGSAAHDLTAWDGSALPGTISGITAHAWTADSAGLYHTTADLKSEWTGVYAQMLAGHADVLSPLQRMEGNAEAVIENTKAGALPAGRQAALREDLQREYDAIDAAMRVNQAQYGIDPNRQFNSYTYLKMEQTLQADERLQELGYQGHGTNNPSAARYRGFTTDFQNTTDGDTFYVGGGTGNGEKAIADFLDDDVLTHAPFPTVMHDGQWTQLNQNGDLENSLADAVSAANATTYTRVLVASDFSANQAAQGEVRLVPNAQAAPSLPTAGAGQVSTLDGSVVSGTVTGITAHSWTTDASGLFHTATDLAAEWKADLGMVRHNQAVTPLQRWEANAEALLEASPVAKLPAAAQAAVREDVQRQLDAVWAAMRMDQDTLGIPATARFTDHSYLMMERTLRSNEQLEELAVQGHGLNGAAPAKYTGFVGLQGAFGTDKATKAFVDFIDEGMLTNAASPTVLHNGKAWQLDQDGTRISKLDTAVALADFGLFDLSPALVPVVRMLAKLLGK